MTYPITLTSSGNIVDIGEYQKPLPLLDIPQNIERSGKNYVFYCESAKKPNNDLIRQGDGSKNDPFVDVNHALEVLCCFAKKVCPGCISFELRVTGFVNYTISPRVVDKNRDFFDGNGVISIILNEASWAIDSFVDYTSGEAVPPIIERLKGFELHGNSCVNDVSGASSSTDDGWGYFGGGPSFIRDCEDCYFSFEKFSQFVTSESNGVTFDSDSLIHNCTRCEFNISNIVVTSQSKEAQESIDTYVVIQSISGNNLCRFDNISVYYDLRGLSGRVTGNVDIYHSNFSCSFVNCSAGIDLVVGPDAYGCGFSNNSNATWLEKNVGYCFSWDDRFGNSGEVNAECTTNANCGHEPPSSSYEPPSSSYEPPSSSYEPPSSSYQPPSSSYEPPSSSYEPPPSSTEPPSEDIVISPVKGCIKAYPFTRSTRIRLYAMPFVQDTDACIYNIYVTQIGYNVEYRERKWSHTYGLVDKVQGEMIDMGEDENGNPVKECEYWEEDPCTSANFAEAVPAAIRSGNADITKWINGTLKEFPLPTDIPIGDNQEWTGFSNYYRRGSLGYINPAILKDGGETLIHTTQTLASYYSIWGETPCTTGDGAGEIVIDTVVFTWEPPYYNDPENVKPKYVVLEAPNGKLILCELDKEYCLMGNAYVDRDMLTLTSCQVDNIELDCPFVVLKGTTSEYNCNQSTIIDCEESDRYRKPENHIKTAFTYKGVVY